MPSFASRVKKELTELPSTQEEAQAELSAFIRMNGSLLVGNQGIVVEVQTENAATARRIYQLLTDHFHVYPEIVVRKKMKLKKNNIYLVRIRTHVTEFLEELGILGESGLIMSLSADELPLDCQKKAYLRGAFLAGGSVNNPNSSYHLEIYSLYQQHNEAIRDLMNYYDFNARTIDRRSGYITYLKEADKISDFLALIGASRATLQFENVRVTRNMRNSINRRINCENANINKTVDAAQRQISNIEYIDQTVGLNQLPEKLQEMAQIRLDNPYADLKTLGEQVPNGPLSKSAVNHRLRKINAYADQLRKEEG